MTLPGGGFLKGPVALPPTLATHSLSDAIERMTDDVSLDPDSAYNAERWIGQTIDSALNQT